MAATSRASPTARAGNDNGMVTVEAAIALCAFVTVLAMTLAGMATVFDQLRCTDAAREAARLVARGEQDEAADAVGRIAPHGATFTVTDEGDGIVVDVRDPAAGGLLPGVHVTADAYAVPEPDADSAAERSTRPTGGDGR
jgi:Flp pilus assembly protein TadG